MTDTTTERLATVLAGLGDVLRLLATARDTDSPSARAVALIEATDRLRRLMG